MTQVEVLLSALKRERNKVFELSTKISVIKKQYVHIVQSLRQQEASNKTLLANNEGLKGENDSLVEKIA